MVGAVIARLIEKLCEKKSANIADFHIIGHSLGAHIAGYAGKRLSGLLGRITGLDPAGPYFENTEKSVRLDSSDAVFVDVIHTDGSSTLQLGLGLMQPIGHADFYPNGGRDQPKCPATSGKILAAIFNVAAIDYDGLEESLGCSHLAAVYFYTDSIQNRCKFQAYHCESDQEFKAGKCLRCSAEKGGCNRMGYWARGGNAEYGSLYLNTQPPMGDSFCKTSYVVSLESNNALGLVRTVGTFKLSFQMGSGLISSPEVLDDCAVTFKPDSVEDRLLSVDGESKVEEIDALYVSFSLTSNFLTSWMHDSKWSFRFVYVNWVVEETGDRAKQRFCPEKVVIKSGETVKFLKC